MPIGKQIVPPYATARHDPTDPRTAVFNAVPLLPPLKYKHPVHPQPRVIPHPPSSTESLNYFHAVSTGQKVPRVLAGTPTLALHLYRRTETHRLPVAERLLLGPGEGAPFYTGHLSPSPGCTAEYNSLIITKRHPVTGEGTNVCKVDIEPDLGVFTRGALQVAQISSDWGCIGQRAEAPYILVWADGKTSESQGECWQLLGPKGLIIQAYPEEGWETLDDLSHKGAIKFKAARDTKLNIDALGFTQDPRKILQDMAYMDFRTSTPVLVSQSDDGHTLLDLIVATLFTILVVNTRKYNLTRPPPFFMTNPPPRYWR